jgi:hypothetical protein
VSIGLAFVKYRYRTHSMILEMLPCELYIYRSSDSPDFAKEIVSILCYKVRLVT